MTDRDVLAIIKRKSTIPNEGESFDTISKAYDRAIQIIQQHITDETKKTGAYLLNTAELREDFLEGQKISDTEDATVFHHGICTVFALALNQLYGYELLCLFDSQDESHTLGNIIHVFCEVPNHDINFDYYVDAQGITDDITEICEGFEDFFTEPLILETTPEELKAEIISTMGEETANEWLQKAVAFIKDHENRYKYTG